MVLGGYYSGILDSIEIFNYRDNVWDIADKLPFIMEGVRATNIDNRMLIFGITFISCVFYCF